MIRSCCAALIAILTLSAARPGIELDGAAPLRETFSSGQDQLTAAEKAAGWRSLFDGKTTAGWRGYRKKTFPDRGWKVVDGSLQVLAGGGGGDIVSEEQFGDFELALEWRVSAKANSGIMYRVTEKHGAPWQTGPEFQILDDAGSGLEATDAHSAGGLYDLAAPPPDKVLLPVGQWNHSRIRLHHNHLEHWLNGARTVSMDLASDAWKKSILASKFRAYEGFGVQPRGHIALQDHGNDVWFRNIKVRALDAPLPGEVTLFNGKDLSNWDAFLNGGASMESVFSVKDGMMICKGSPAGYIYTKELFTNYVLKLEWRFDPVTKKAGNSGVLLRMTGEHKVWPRSVEAQLQSGSAGDFWNIDKVPMKVAPERTRGRNTKKTHGAEYPIGEWNEYEILVNAGDVHLRVNGQLLNKAWDVAVVAGRICLQSEGAPIHFRNIRLAPITSR